MSIGYAGLSSELCGNLPGLSGFLADQYINRAYRKIRDAKLWSFLETSDSIVCPAQITAGAFNITQYNNQVTANAAASAAISLVAPVILPFQFLQIRFQGVAQTSQIYNITAVDTTVPTALVLTLDRVVQEATNTGSPYLMYRAYVAVPTSDFLRWDSFVDMVNGFNIKRDCTSQQFDRIDPQRQALGLAYNLGYYQPSTDAQPTPTVPIYELWPGPTSGQTFFVRYRRRGVDFAAPTDVQPDLIPDDLIIQAALGFYAYPFAMANPGHFPSWAKVNWMQLITDAKKQYYISLQDAKRQDDNQALNSVIARGHGLRDLNRYPYPIDANFIQGHLINQ